MVLLGPGVMDVTNPKVAAVIIKLRVSTYVSKQFSCSVFDIIIWRLKNNPRVSARIRL